MLTATAAIATIIGNPAATSEPSVTISTIRAISTPITSPIPRISPGALLIKSPAICARKPSFWAVLTACCTWLSVLSSIWPAWCSSCTWAYAIRPSLLIASRYSNGLITCFTPSTFSISFSVDSTIVLCCSIELPSATSNTTRPVPAPASGKSCRNLSSVVCA